MKRLTIWIGLVALALPAPALASNKGRLERAVMEQDSYTHPARPKRCHIREVIDLSAGVIVSHQITRHCGKAFERRRAAG